MNVLEDRPPFLVRATIWFVALGIVGFLVWAAHAEVEEITRGEGRVIPASRTQLVQASEAGVVAEIAVAVGQVVHSGDLIVRLDDTTTASSLGEQEARGRALMARVARLRQEQEGDFDSPLVCPDALSDLPAICENEQRLLTARRDNFRAKLSVLESRLEQRRKELDEAILNLGRLNENLTAVKTEAELVTSMVKRGLMARTEQLRVDREQADLAAQVGLAGEAIARTRAAVNEAELQVGELALQLKQEALNELTQSLAELSVVQESIRGASDRVKRTDIRSPVDGIVNTLELNTIGSFVQPGAVVAGIVPTSGTLLVEARISPKDVAFLRPGQLALIKITAYDFSIFGGLGGTVDNISADSLVDTETGEAFYQVRVKTDTAALERNGQSYPIIPGMVGTVEIMTGSKTILDYLMKPINKARDEALRER
ncbi:MAG: HlyD family type I secretion periplasmic adaptor subunit [Rhizobiaceae bacterium]